MLPAGACLWVAGADTLEVPMSEPEVGQPRATTREGMRIEKAAIFLLSRCISWSVYEQKECGGVIYRDTANGQIRATGPFVATASANTVDVGQNLENFGLAATLKPVAWYHTHPLVIRSGMHFEWDKFEEGDFRLSYNKQIPGYVCSMDGQMWRFDPPPEQGQDPETSVMLPIGPGRWGKILNVPRVAINTQGATPYQQPREGLAW
jgi:hypothetical protein